MTKVTWRAVVGYEGLYEVSDQGHIASLPRFKVRSRRLLKGWIANRTGGYRMVALCKPNEPVIKYTVHSLVAAAFIGARPEGSDIRHLDGNPLNCCVGNLTYGTRSENNFDAVRHGTHWQTKKTHCPKGHSYLEHGYSIPSRPTARYCGECNKVNTAIQNAKAKSARRAAKGIVTP